ncbi:fructose-1,6-bisphosphatase [Treponema zioleckii]|uniref:fructose-1,6-bisphosphatase n=1 Tax=Treponema zioleckii TaxID=331680 RepID=UPI00168AF2E7|nr:fructose-1,6-bisphosphatase [Treponema zioleckii]
MENKKYLNILARQYPTEQSVITEIVNLQAILSLPKGTEHFLTDIHGENQQFSHVLRNGSGSIRTKIDEVFGNTITQSVKRSLATLIYYPKEKLEIVRQNEEDMDDWYTVTLHRLVAMLCRVSSKYTRSKVRKAMPEGFAYVIEELITEKEEVKDKQAYYNSIIQTVIRIGAAESLIEALCNMIQQLVIDHLHIIGDIFDRGPGPHLILDSLLNYHSLDIQWGNHDVVWMGAAAGSKVCIANVVRLCARYNNLDVLEEGYGINLTPLVTFCMKNYGKMDREAIHRAISVIQFKIEDKLIRENPEFEMQNRLILDKIDFDKKTILIDGKTWSLKIKDFKTDLPTLNPKNPCELTDEEINVMNRLYYSFTHCEKLQRHVKFLYQKGNLYKIFNGNLLYHGCMPLDGEGKFLKVKIFGKEFAGRALYDELELWARRGYFSRAGSKEKEMGENILWYLWTGPKSPLFGKDKMACFENMFVEDKAASHEHKNHYYDELEDETIVDSILKEFSLDTKTAHIINGHVPQEVKKGDSPIKCGGKLLIIDGGFAAAYHEKTGIAGYTLVINSYGMRLVVHEKFTSCEQVIATDSDIVSDTIQVEKFPARHYVADTDRGAELKEQIAELEALLKAYRSGELMRNA